MSYQAAAERLFPGEAEMARLPWAWISDEDKRCHVTEPRECADCHMGDLPCEPGWLLCMYCLELRRLRRERAAEWPD